MTKLSVNINKIATFKCSWRNVPIIKSSHRHSKICAEGITIHPRPDERHIRQDARDLKAIVYTEYNIEGNPANIY
jgi:pyridoxine 5-phosphate synthase